LAKLLGPAERAKPGIESKQVRKAIADVIGSLAAGCYKQAKPASLVLSKLCLFHVEHVDEIDIDSVLPALNTLSQEENWRNLAKEDLSSKPSLLLPLVHSCFFFLYGEDGVVARSAFKALKIVVALAAKLASEEDTPLTSENWNLLLAGCILPVTRNCLNTGVLSVRRFIVLLLREIALHCQSSPSPHLHGDLAQLIREDDPDLDFFLNITQ